MHVGDVVHREGAHQARLHRGALEGTGLVFHHRLGGDDGAVFLGAHLHFHHRARGRAGGAEHFVAAHDDFHRAAGFAREGEGNGFEIDDGFATETTADFHRDDADVGQLNAQQLGAESADHEMTLAGGVDRALAIGGDGGDTGMRLDIGLMHGGSHVAAFGDDVGRGEAGIDIARFQHDFLRDVGRRGGLGVHAGGEHLLVQHRGVGRHGGFDVDDMRQDFIRDLDQRQSRIGDGVGGRGDRSHRMAFIQRLAARHDVQRLVAEIGGTFADEGFRRVDVRQVGGGHHRFHAGQGFGLGGVDLDDARMGVRAAQDFADELAGQPEIGAIGGAAGDFFHPIRANRTGANNAQIGFVANKGHTFSPRISAAASITARMILS